MKVLLFCCKSFEMMEFSVFYDVCGWAKSEYGFDMQMFVQQHCRLEKLGFWKAEMLLPII